MIRLVQYPIVALAWFAVACGRSPSPPPPKPDANSMVQVGEASFYGNDSAGQKTANGERLKLNGMTAASRTLPLGTHVEVTNKETGQSTKVRINDRGPYVDGRVIDLTPKAARRIGIDRTDGVAPVIVKPTTPDTNPK